jgi:hypothetical protein
LLDKDGVATPFQVEDGVLSFVTELKKGQTAEFKLQAAPRGRSAENSKLSHQKTKKAVEIQNEHLAVRLPAAQEKKFKEPVPADQVPPPILAWKQQGFGWVGGARFFTERKVSSYQITCVSDGPASVAYEARYRFVPAGEYLWQIRVSHGLRYALITEEFDSGGITEGHDFLMLGLGEGWQPEQVGFVENGELKRQPAAQYLEQKAKEQESAVSNVSSYVPPRPFMPGQRLVLLEKITPTGAWGSRGGLELRASRKDQEKTLTQSISVCPWHTGSWRRTLAMLAWHDPARGIELALPISVRPARWYMEVTDDLSPFSTHEHDPELPVSFGRRVWALGFGLDNIVAARMNSGYVGLDRRKDWIIDWPEDKAKAKYPRAFTTPELLDRIRKSLPEHPDRANLEPLYLINGKPESAIASAKQALGGLQGSQGSAWQVFGMPGYMEIYFRVASAVYAEDALSCPDLPADLRAELRRHLALAAYLCADSDYDPRPAGVHLGNPNMPIGRALALVLLAALLPDHPLYQDWMTQMRTWTEYRLAINTSPGGAWFEPPTYKMYGPTRALTIAQVLLRNGGFGDLAALGYHAKALTYDANLTMPDPRYKGWRVLCGMGNSGNTLEGVWGMGVGVVEQADRDCAGFLRSMHRLCSGNERVCLGRDPDYAFFNLPDVPEKPRTLKTTYTPGYGIAFRAHYGSPLETAMLFRSGYNKSHWDTDDLNVVLYGKGAPLSPGTGYQYYYGPASQNNAIYHNRVKPGKLDAREPFGRVENTIQDYGFGESADYAVGREYFPPEYFDDGKGEMEWRRHVLFLKSARPEGASYFVLRDSFMGPDGKPGGAGRSAWWHWLNLESADRVRVDGKAFDKEAVAFNKVVPDDQMPALRGRTLEMATSFGASTWLWFAQPADAEVRAAMTFDYPMGPNYHHRAFGKALGVLSQEDKETKTRIRVAGKADEGFFYVVYPLKDGETGPKCSSPAPGCLKVVTPEATDYVFANDTPLDFSAEEVVFSGKAGAVRLFPDRVVLCLNSGSGRIGYKGCLFRGSGPFERTTAIQDLRPGETDVGGTERQIVTVDIGRGITVRGEAPFTATLDGEAIRIKTSGRARTLTVTLPPFIVRPDLFLDGQRWMAGWSDWASSDWGRMKNSYLMAVSTLDGDHELVIRNMTFPKTWHRPFDPTIGRSPGAPRP